VFDRVIQEVCDGSQVDFEESGVDQQTLLDLRKVSSKIYSIFEMDFRGFFGESGNEGGIDAGFHGSRPNAGSESCGRRQCLWGGLPAF
jgi:hypothetical protein